MDPDVLARIAPTELAPGEDPVERFRREVEAVEGTIEVVGADGVVDALVAAVTAHAPAEVLLAADLDAYRGPLADRLRADGIACGDYERIVGDRARVAASDVAVTGCLAAVAATGSIVTGGASGRGGALVAPHHVCVVERERLLSGLLALLQAVPTLGPMSAIALQSGPSRTADIEKTLILGMHGPKTVHIVLVDDVAASPDGGATA